MLVTHMCLSQQMFCYNKHNFVVTKVLSWQAYFCHDKTFVTRKMILVAAPASDRIWQGVVRIDTLVHQWQSVFRVYHSFIMTKYACRDKRVFVATNVLLRQQLFCHGKHTFVATKFLS